MKRKPIREFSLPRHYTHLGTYGRYEVMRKGRVYKHSYLKQIDEGEIEDLGYETKKAVDEFETRATQTAKAYQVETDFTYEVDGVEYDYTIKSSFRETVKEAMADIDFEIEDRQKKFIISGIKKFETGDIKLNCILNW